MDHKEYLLNMGKMDKEFASIYRRIASCFGISECAMWVMYYLSLSDKELTQQDLQELLMFPKQTINSAVINLEKKGYLHLEMIPGTKNLKKISYTEKGTDLAEQTVRKVIKAEMKAVQSIGIMNVELYLAMHEDYIRELKDAFKQEGVLDDGTV